MMKYILYDAVTNILTARYDDSINTIIPSAAIVVDDSTFFKTINEQDGIWALVGGVAIKKPFPIAPILTQIILSSKKIDADVDFIYGAVMGNRSSEYALAESDAIAYKAAIYTGTVPSSVSSWATASGNTAQWATDNIIATATSWRAVQSAMRATRLLLKQTLKSATTQAAIDTANASWNSFVIGLKAQLGIA